MTETIATPARQFDQFIDQRVTVLTTDGKQHTGTFAYEWEYKPSENGMSASDKPTHIWSVSRGPKTWRFMQHHIKAVR